MGKTVPTSIMKFVPLSHPDLAPLSLALEEGNPVVLESRPRSTVYLGAICDGRGMVKSLVEIWTQDFSRDRDSLTLPVLNVVADQQWGQMVKGYASAESGNLWRGEWEDKGVGALVVADDEWWAVCEDNAWLAKRELPSYSESEFRYLVSADKKKILALSSDAPMGPNVKLAEKVFKGHSVFNREGGRLMVREAHSFNFGNFVDFLGKEGSGLLKEALRLPLAKVGSKKIPGEGVDRAGAGFLMGRSGVADRIAEIFFLKLCAIRGALSSVQEALASLKIPFGGLTEDSFGVEISPTGMALPFLWTHQVLLCDTPRFAPFLLGPRGEVFPLAVAPENGSIYSPPGRFHSVSGFARLHVKSVTLPDDDGLVVISGTLRTSEVLESSRKDLLRLGFNAGGGKRGEFYATLETRKGDEDWRFLSFPMIPPPGITSDLVGESGTLFEKVSFDLYPGVGATRDLYSLAVLAFRVLFTAGGSQLSEKLDEFFDLVRKFSGGSKESEWSTGAGQLLDFVNSASGEKWREGFGPHNVVEQATPELAYDAIPKHLWWSVVSWIGQLFPGSMSGSFSNDFDDFDRRAPELVFEAPLVRLDELIDQARLLLFGNASVNRDLLRVVMNVKNRSRS